MSSHHNRAALLATAALAMLYSSTASSAITRYYAGNICTPQDLHYYFGQWVADYSGLFYIGDGEPALPVRDAYCAVVPPSATFTTTSWQVRVLDQNTSDCLRCNFFYKTTAGGTLWGSWRYSAPTSGGTTWCSNPSYTGYNSLSHDLSVVVSNAAQVGFRCRVPDHGTGPSSGFMGYRLSTQ